MGACEPESEPGLEPADGETEVLDGEVVDGLPVLVGQAAELEPAHWSARPTVQAAAAAATGFVAGAATLALMRRYGLRRVAREVNAVRDAIDPRWRSPFPPGPGQTYIVHVRVVQPRQPE